MNPHFPSPHSSARSSGLAAPVLGLALAVVVPAQQPLAQFVELPGHELVSVPVDEAQVLAEADLDGDLLPDLVIGSSVGCRMLRNDGYGGFAEVSFPSVVMAVSEIAFGDVDGDGDRDLLVGTSGFGTGHPAESDRIFLNDGRGQFADATATLLPLRSTHTDAVVLGDLDGDGDQDAVVHDASSQTELLWNDGSGRFFAGATFQSSGGHGDLLLGDLDSDGDLDLISPGRIFRNDGAGQFTDVTSTALGAVSFTATSVVDLDGDGDLDLLGLGRQISTGTPPGGGVPIIFPSLAVEVFLNDGSGAFSMAQRTSTLGRWTPRAHTSTADLDGDGDVDAFVSWYGGSPWAGFEPTRRVLWNDGHGGLIEDASRLSPIVDGDLLGGELLFDADGDRDVDIVMARNRYGPSGTDAFVSLETNVQRQLTAPVAPRVGQSWSIEAWMRYGPQSLSDLALPVVSAAPASIPLAGLGTLGIDLSASVPLTALSISATSGRGTLQIQIPADPALRGGGLYLQALFVAHPWAPRLSNVVRTTIE